MGINFEKEWMATLDGRTRHSHGMLDGVHVPVNKKFSNGLMYPADPSGAASEVYNCRCTLVPYFGDLDAKHGWRMTYKEWIKEKTHPVFEGVDAYGDRPKDLLEASKNIDRELSKYTDKESKWSKQTIIVPRE